MRTIKVDLYKLEELSEKVQEEVIERLCTCNIDYDWWAGVYDSASNEQIKITSFNMDRCYSCNITFMESEMATAELIVEGHGKESDTYKISKEFIREVSELDAEVDEDQIEYLNHEYEHDISQEYLKILRDEYEWLTSEESIRESIICNEYEFTNEGKMQ